MPTFQNEIIKKKNRKFVFPKTNGHARFLPTRFNFLKVAFYYNDSPFARSSPHEVPCTRTRIRGGFISRGFPFPWKHFRTESSFAESQLPVAQTFFRAESTCVESQFLRRFLPPLVFPYFKLA